MRNELWFFANETQPIEFIIHQRPLLIRVALPPLSEIEDPVWIADQECKWEKGDGVWTAEFTDPVFYCVHIKVTYRINDEQYIVAWQQL